MRIRILYSLKVHIKEMMHYNKNKFNIYM
jgi:hypothetical protein